MSDDENNRKQEDKPSKEGKKPNLVDATHLLKAEALRRLQLKDLEAEESVSENAEEGVKSRPTSAAKPGPSSIEETGKSDSVDIDSKDQTGEIVGRNEDKSSRPQSGSRGFSGLSKDINNSAISSGLGNAEDSKTAGEPKQEPRPESGLKSTADSSDKTKEESGIDNLEKQTLPEESVDRVSKEDVSGEEKSSVIHEATVGEERESVSKGKAELTESGEEVQGALDLKPEQTAAMSDKEEPDNVNDESAGSKEEVPEVRGIKEEAKEVTEPSNEGMNEEGGAEPQGASILGVEGEGVKEEGAGEKEKAEDKGIENGEDNGKVDVSSDKDAVSISQVNGGAEIKAETLQAEKLVEDQEDLTKGDGEGNVEAVNDKVVGEQEKKIDAIHDAKASSGNGEVAKIEESVNEADKSEKIDASASLPKKEDNEVAKREESVKEESDFVDKADGSEKIGGSASLQKKEKTGEVDAKSDTKAEIDGSASLPKKGETGEVDAISDTKAESNDVKDSSGASVAAKLDENVLDGSINVEEAEKIASGRDSANESKKTEDEGPISNETGEVDDGGHKDDNIKKNEDESGKTGDTKENEDVRSKNLEDEAKTVEAEKSVDKKNDDEQPEGVGGEKEEELTKEEQLTKEERISKKSTEEEHNEDVEVERTKVAGSEGENEILEGKPADVAAEKVVAEKAQSTNAAEAKGEGVKLKEEPKEGGNKEGVKEKNVNEDTASKGGDDGVTGTASEEGTAAENLNVTEGEGTSVEFEVSEEHLVPPNFYYDNDKYASKAFTTDGVPENMLSLFHSFGFECTKRSNLHMLNDESMLFSAGNVAQILNINTNKLTYIRSTGGGGIGAIAVHPSRKYFAVAEKGVKPNIVIYEYPSLRLYRILRDGTELAYANLDFSPNGEKLASVGSAPDYMLTVWDWRNENIVLRTKAFSQEVYKIAFSPEDEGHLCSSGTGHIRFWKMATTFTGLKLQGELGRFGTTELSDIAGFVELPDGKVLSGSEWGNMLLWDGGLIKVEIARKGKKTCHLGMIEQFFLDEGELITIGADGFVKVWDFESIDTADAADESKIFEMEPMSELKVGSDVKLMSMVKSVNANEISIWYAQDAAGGIWKLDLSFSHTSHAPKKLYSYHAGMISGLAVSPVTHLSATTGSDNTVRLYDYLAKTQLCHSKFTAAGSSILWLPKTVDSDGLSLLSGFADGVVRYFTVAKSNQSTITAKKNGSNFELTLSQVFKPHTKPVTSLAVSKDGKFLATGGDDSTVFFFSIEKMKFKAIGFIETGAPVVSLDWSSVQRNNHLLICCSDGCVLEVSCPKPDKYDTTKTYQLPLPGIKKKEFKFISIKDKLVKAEEEARKAKEEEQRQKQLEEERRKRKARGIEDDEENKDEEETEESEAANEEDEEEEVHHELGKIVKGFYKGETGGFWLLLDGWDAGYIYECGFPKQNETDVEREPLRAVKFDEIDDVAVMSHYFSKSGQYLALGLENGAIRIQVLESHDLSTLNSYWRLNMHDNQSGAVVSISMSFDEKFLLSVGRDGNFFVYSFMDEKKVMEIIGKQRAEVAAKAEAASILKIDDIDDPNHYSIELEKQKAEHDRMMRFAEEKKQQVRQTINLLRIEFKKLAARNQEMPTYLQLPASDFIMDPEMKNDIAKETEKKIELLEREMAWESEKCSLALKKLETRFKVMIECERFTLRAFNTSHKIFSYRATALPREFSETLEVTKNRSKTSEVEIIQQAGGKRLSFLVKRTRAESVSEEVLPEVIQTTKKAKPAQNLDEKIAKAIEKAEQKKKRRQARQAEWNEFYRSKPDQNKEDPLDLAAIKEAQDNMGDFKLKTAKDYIVPEKQRVNAEKKRVQLMELKEQIYQLKHSFNEKLLHLRDKKIACIEEVKGLAAELETVQNGLPSSMHIAIPVIPTMLPDEQPEKLYEITKEILMKFKLKKEEESNQTLKSENTGGFGGGFGGFGGGEQNQQTTTKLTSQMASTRTEQRGRSTSILSTLSSQPRSGSSLPPDRGTPDTIREEHMIDQQPSDIELKIRDEQRLRLVYQRDMLLKKIRDLLISFDAELRIIRHEKIHLDVDLKIADLRIITLFEELVLLKEFEKRENMLMSKVIMKAQEKDDMQDKVEDCHMKLQAKKEEIERLHERDKALYTTFTSTVGDSNKFEAFLTKVFKKKIKRVKKTEQNEGSDEESDDDFSDDDYDSEEDEDSESEELDDSVCPPGCDQAIFDQVCQLREKRLDLEEATAEEKKAAETLKKELDALQKKAKVIDTGLMTAEADLEAFQREKQQKLNELDVIVTLKLSQLQYLNNSALPQDLSQSLVFTSSSLESLQRRIKELEKEKTEQKKLYWQRRQEHVQLIRNKKDMETKISQLQEKVEQMQLLKFGRLVNLEKLETVSVNKLAEEIKEQLRVQEFANAKEIAGWEKRIDEAKAKLTQVTRENTRRLDTYTVLLEEQKGLEGQLDSRQKNLGGEFQGNRKADYQERQRLIQLAQLQSQEIEALKEEIGLLSRKGGHILPPSQAPVPHAPPAR